MRIRENTGRMMSFHYQNYPKEIAETLGYESAFTATIRTIDFVYFQRETMRLVNYFDEFNEMRRYFDGKHPLHLGHTAPGWRDGDSFPRSLAFSQPQPSSFVASLPFTNDLLITS